MSCTVAERRLAQLQSAGPIPFRIAGLPVERSAAMQRATELLAKSRRPLIYGLNAASCEAQRLAVELAEQLGGVIDPAAPETSFRHSKAWGTSARRWAKFAAGAI